MLSFITTLIYFILILGVIVLVHEFGHFIFSKMFGIYVYEFSIGMGPKLFSWKKEGGETAYSIRLIPIGGFCSLAGEGNDEDGKLPKDRLLQSKPVWQRFLVMFFGAGNNFILAVLLLFTIACIWGAPNTVPRIKSVDPEMPASLTELAPGDIITKVNGNTIQTNDDLSIYIQISKENEPIVMETKSLDGTIKTVELTPKIEEVDGNKVYRIGIHLDDTIKHGIADIIGYTYRRTVSLFKQMFITLGGLFTGKIGVKQLSGPVGIYNIVGSQAKSGIENVLALIALLSINVGFINLLPFPAFDGGRILFLIIEKIKGSPVKPETENMIHNIGFFLLLALMLYVTFNDIIKLF